jgi:pyridoxal phosphate enzyme (YggS family)
VSVAEHLGELRERIARAAAAAGRDPASVQLLAVGKTKPASSLREAYAAGQRDFGENYAKELLAKADDLADLQDIRWHMIGHVQRNKARSLVRVVSVVHTLDSVRLIEELGKRAQERAEPLACLVEVNVGGEAQKAGCAPPELGGLLDAIEAQPALALRGLMTVPPHTEDPAGARPFFDELVRLRDAHGGAQRLPELSMGMTHDLEHAIAAGATIVRVGTAIFGERS